MIVAVGMGLLVLPLLYAGLMVWLRAGWAENAAALEGQSGIRNRHLLILHSSFLILH